MRVAVLILVLTMAFDAVAQSTATKGLSGPTLRLFKAVELNDISAVKGSLEDGADLKKENDDGMTAADLAVDLGHFIIAHYLLSRKLLGETEPIMLAPGAAPNTAKAPSLAKPKTAFAKPPEKPVPPAPAAAAKPAAAPKEATAEPTAPTPAVAETPPAPAAEPSPAPATAEAPTEVPRAAGAETPVAAAESPPADQPLGDIGVVRFFKSLVDLITPGGEKPAEVAAAKPNTGTPTPTAMPETPAEKSAAQGSKTEPPEIVVDITGDGKPTGEIIKEIKEPPLPKLAEKDFETITAETVTAEPQAETAKPAAAPEGEAAPKAAAPKPEKREPSVLDRMADLMKPDQEEPKPAVPKAAEKAAAPGSTPPAAKPAPAATPNGAHPGTPEAVTAYELPPTPTLPTAQNKFSPHFLDKLADFLESGDETAFKAWLPELQIMGAAAGGRQSPPPSAAKPADQAPPTESAAVTAKTEPPATTEAPVMKAKTEAPATAPEMSADDAVEADLAGIAGEAPSPSIAVADGAPSQPATATPASKPGMIRGAFNKLLGVLTPAGRDIGRSERLVLEPEEKLAAVDKDGQQGKPAPTAEVAQKVWPVTEVETAKTPPIGPPRRVSDVLLKTSLTGVTLSLGESVSLENSFPPSQDGIDPQNQCVKKNRGTTLFCLEPIDWPDRVQADFLVPTILYTGHKAIARYDQGIASRFHALFPSTSFDRVVAYFRDRFGQPTDIWNRSIAPFAKPRQDNPTMAWRSVDPKTGAITVLEIRKYDDTRGGFPDTNRGAVMLYLANSPPIFPQVSSHELMRLSRTRMGPPSAEPAPNAAPGAPPGAPAAAPAGAPAPDPYALPEPGATPDVSLPEPGVKSDQSSPEPGAETQPGAAGKTAKQLKDEARAKRRAEREAKRAAGAAKQAAGQAKQEIGAKRAPKPATVPAAPDQSLDLPPDPLNR